MLDFCSCKLRCLGLWERWCLLATNQHNHNMMRQHHFDSKIPHQRMRIMASSFDSWRVRHNLVWFHRFSRQSSIQSKSHKSFKVGLRGQGWNWFHKLFLMSIHCFMSKFYLLQTPISNHLMVAKSSSCKHQTSKMWDILNLVLHSRMVQNLMH